LLSPFRLLGFFVKRVLTAEPAILVHFQSVRVILLVLFGVVIALLALGADKRNLDSCFISHSFGTSRFKKLGFARQTHTKPRVPPSLRGPEACPESVSYGIGASGHTKKALSTEVALLYHNPI
jgi:hypothetical protein